MSKIFFTSDTHFNHANILKYEPINRPFNTTEEMNETIINNWNSVVGKEDTVYHLGDFFMGPLDSISSILKRLNGHITLIRGNHDTSKRRELYEKSGIIIKDIEYLSYKGKFFIMCHFPIASQEFINMVRQDNSETVVLYGHVHHNAPRGYVDGTYHVGLDTNDLLPIDIEQIWKECSGDGIQKVYSTFDIEIFNPLKQGKPSLPEYLRRCSKCVYFPFACGHSDDMGACTMYKRDPPDGGSY